MVTAGEVLKTKRESLKKSIQQVSQETKIQERFLEYIENDQYENFDSDVFVSGFIKIYSDNLGLDTERVLALYRRGNGHVYDTKNKKSKKIMPKKGLKSFFTPKNIAIAITALSLLGILAYIGYEIFLYQNPPEITVTTPKNNITTDDSVLLIEGSVEDSSYITIAEQKIDITEENTFSSKYTLEEGENTIIIKAVKEKTKQEAVATLTITYIPKEEETKKEETVDKYTLKLVIQNDITWIKLDVDGINKISQVLEPSERSYEIKERFEIVSGRPGNTTIYLNDEIYELKEDPSNGTYKLSCEILQTGPVCR